MAQKKGVKRPKRDYDPAIAKQVQAIAQYGVPYDKIALILGMAPMTLMKRYRVELDKGTTLANLNIAKTLYQKAIDGDTASLIFWCKTRLHWREKDRPEDMKQEQDSGRDWKKAFRDAFNSVGKGK